MTLESQPETSPLPQHTAWALIVSIAVVRLIAHLVTSGNYGMFRDEFYYLACADHLAWGYVDHPPLSIALLAGWKALVGDSVQAIRILSALVASVSVVLVGVLARELGGGRFAQGLSALVVAVVPPYIAIGGFYSMNVFEIAIWAGAFVMLARIVNTDDPRRWIPLGILLGIGLLNKISVLVLGAGIAGGIVLTPWRRHLRSTHLWIGGAIAVVLFLPHIVWQTANGWPTLEFIANAKQYKIAAYSPFAFFVEQVMMMHPAFFPLWLFGLGYLMLARRMAPYRIFGWVFLIAFVLIVVQRSKPYYLVAAYPPLFVAASIAVERITRQRLGWARPAVAIFAILAGLMSAPLVLPALPVETLIRYQAVLGLEPRNAENSTVAELPQLFADRFGWQEMTRVVASVYEGLPEEDRGRCLIVAGNYGEAGAISYYGREYGLPRVVSTHNSYFLWGLGDTEPTVLISIGIPEEDLNRLFDSVTAAAVVDTEYSMPYERGRVVYVVRDFKVPLAEAFAGGKRFI